jgi:hypothetical protein
MLNKFQQITFNYPGNIRINAMRIHLHKTTPWLLTYWKKKTTWETVREDWTDRIIWSKEDIYWPNFVSRRRTWLNMSSYYRKFSFFFKFIYNRKDLTFRSMRSISLVQGHLSELHGAKYFKTVFKKPTSGPNSEPVQSNLHNTLSLYYALKLYSYLHLGLTRFLPKLETRNA